MGIIYDTAVLVRVERNGDDPASLLSGKREGPFGISVVSVAELLHGAHRADTPERRARRIAFVDEVCATLPVFEYDTAAAKVFAEIWSSTAQRGITIGVNDLIIASTAISRGYAVVTCNGKDFKNIDGIRLEVMP
jgi:tRNA(fMet)-specific endonuclease VapC